MIAPQDTDTLVATLREIVGHRGVLTDPAATERFRHGYRIGSGAALAVVRPRSLIQLWRVAQACVAADVSIIMQAANTGLTGGSTPCGEQYPGGVVIINTAMLRGVHVIGDGGQVVCLPGATLNELEKVLRPLGREPHSVIGSSCLGASVVGGVCNNSGGSLIQRGPAFTQLALFGRIDADRRLRLVNHLGIDLGDEPEQVLAKVENGDFTPADVHACEDRKGHDHSYVDRVREIDSPTPARFNADPRCLFEAAGSAGKVIVFAVRLDTFPAQTGSQTFYIGTNRPERLTALRRTILADATTLPIAGEYMHRAAFDIADVYGKDMFLAVRLLKTHRLPRFFAAKGRLEAWVARSRLFNRHLIDRMMQRAGRLFADHLPPRLRAFRHAFEHHLILKVTQSEVEATRALLSQHFAGEDGGFFECTADEDARAFLHRFVAAGAAIRYRAVHADTVEDIVALDIALPRNTRDWIEILPDDIAREVSAAMYYGHFFCHVFHQDYIVRKGTDVAALEHRLHAALDVRNAEYPAEHNVGHLYRAKPPLANFYRDLDPTNQLNPGIGGTPTTRFWGAG